MKQHSLPQTLSCQKLLLAFLSVIALLVFAPQLASQCFAETATLAWDANSEDNLAGYKIYYSTSSAGGPFDGTGLTQGASPISVDLSALATPGSPSFQLSGLMAGQTYYFAVSAYNEIGIESNYSNVVSYQAILRSYNIQVSSSPDRSMPITLSGQKLSGDIYVFVGPDDGIASVDFFLNGKFWHTENFGPFDFNGGNEKLAAPLNTNELPDGKHEISAAIQLSDGSTLEKIIGNFEANNVTVPAVYSIAASTNGHGSISPSGTVSMTEGSSKAFVFTAEANYHIAEVIIDGTSIGSVAAYSFENISSSHTIEAFFEIDSFSITASAGENGEISPEGTITADFGTSQTFTITPDDGYRVKSIIVDGVLRESGNGLTFDNISASHAIQVDFEVETFSISTSTDGNGSITPNGIVDIAFGSDQICSIIPNPGYQVEDVKVDGNSIGAVTEYTFSNIAENHIVEASFVEIVTEFTMEVGEVSVNNNWELVSFKKPFINPVVVASTLSTNDGDPAVVRIDNVTSTGFEISIQEWDYLDDDHLHETIGYIVMEAGSYILPDGSVVEAGKMKTDGSSAFRSHAFTGDFTETPVVVVSVASYNDPDAVTVRLRSISSSLFEYKVQEQEANSDGHPSETVTYIAWEPCRVKLEGRVFEVAKTKDIINHSFKEIVYSEAFIEPPVIIASMQTQDGGDTASLRWIDRTETNVMLKVEEEQSNDAETSHTSEIVGYIAFTNEKAFKLMMSESPDRSNPVELDGQTVSGSAYIFTAPDENVGSVSFYLDGITHRVERLKPYDFDGGSADPNGFANATDTTLLPDGEHEISAVIQLADGSFLPEIRASFKVDNTAVILDTDQDGLLDEEEINYYGSNPKTTDTDADGISDGDELYYWGENWDDDFDNDSIINILDIDSDGDGLNDGDELSDGFDPSDKNSRPYGLLVSLSPDRTNPVALDGQVVSGDVYIFAIPDINVDNVSFYLDGKFHRVERLKPYDFAGGSADPSGFANATDTTRMANGEYEISVVIQLVDGSILPGIAAYFTVDNTYLLLR